MAIATAAEIRRRAAFLEQLRERGRAPKTIAGYEDDWQALASWFHGTNGKLFDMRELSAMDCADYVGQLKRRQAPATVARRLIFLRSYAQEAYRHKAITNELLERVESLRPPKTQQVGPRGLSAKEAREALRQVEREGVPPRDRAIVYVFLSTGIRVGELAQLERKDVEISERRGSIHVRPEIAKGGRDRSVPIAKEARTFLKAYLSTRKDDSPALFVGQRGPFTDQGIRDIVVKYAGVPPHRLRHTFAYEYLRSNENDLVALADILGHESLNTTRHYTRRRKEDLEEGVENVRYEKRERQEK